MKLVNFYDHDIPFIYSTIGWAVDDLPLDVTTYNYNQLRQGNIEEYSGEVVVFCEIGMLQTKHSGRTINDIKRCFPQSKIVCFASDSIFYLINNLGWQIEDIYKIDLILEVMPQCVDNFRKAGLNAEIIPWTISRRLYKQLRELAGDSVDFSRKTNDFFALWNCSCDYRNNFFDYIKKSDYNIIRGGSGKYDVDDLDQIFDNCMNSFLSCETSSHNRIELLNMGNQKGFRSAISIALNTLVINDNHPNNSVCGMPFPEYKFGEYKSVINLLQWLKRDLSAYEYILKQQQIWLYGNLLDDNFYRLMAKYSLL